jgi:hypothetical protein
VRLDHLRFLFAAIGEPALKRRSLDNGVLVVVFEGFMSFKQARDVDEALSRVCRQFALSPCVAKIAFDCRGYDAQSLIAARLRKALNIAAASELDALLNAFAAIGKIRGNPLAAAWDLAVSAGQEEGWTIGVAPSGFRISSADAEAAIREKARAGSLKHLMALALCAAFAKPARSPGAAAR